MNKLFVLVCLGFLMGCSLPVFNFEPENKRCVQGFVLDLSGNPVPNSVVEIFGVSYGDKLLLNSIKSDERGAFEMCFSETSDIYGLALNKAPILYNTNELNQLNENQIPELGSKVFYFLESDFENETFELSGPEINLPEVATLNLEIIAGFEFVTMDVEYDGDSNRTYIEGDGVSSVFKIGINTIRLAKGSTLTLTHRDFISSNTRTVSILMDSDIVDFKIEL